MGNFVDELNVWLKQPFQTGQSAYKWVLFVGLLIIAIFFWNVILGHIVREV